MKHRSRRGGKATGDRKLRVFNSQLEILRFFSDSANILYKVKNVVI